MLVVKECWPYGCSIEDVAEAIPLFKKAHFAKSRVWVIRFKRLAISKFHSLESADAYAIGEIAATTRSDFMQAWFYEDVRKQIAIMESVMTCKGKGKKPPKR